MAKLTKERTIHPQDEGRVLNRVVDPARSGLRLDKFWALELEDTGISRSRIIQWIKEERAVLNDSPCTSPSRTLRSGDRVTLACDLPEEGLSPIAGPLDILWQDDHLLVLNKPPGLTVHPARSSREPTLAHYLLAAYPETALGDPFRPGIVHRLDKDTSGLMLAARSPECRERLMQDLAARKVDKDYLALVHGCPPAERGRIELPLGRDPKSKTRQTVLSRTGREALTFYQILHVFPGSRFSLLKVRIVTGRTHQIRVHLAHIGLPILGDATYGPASFADLRRRRPALGKLCRRQMLHACALRFRHPLTGEALDLQRTVPFDFQRVLLQLARRPFRVAVLSAPESGGASFCAALAGQRHPLWDWEAALAELLRPGGDGLELVQRAAPRPLDLQNTAEMARSAFQSGTDPAAGQSFLRETLAPLLEHHLRHFLARQEEARLFFARIPPGLLPEGPSRELFDVCILLTPPGSPAEAADPQAFELRITSDGSEADLQVQAEAALRCVKKRSRQQFLKVRRELQDLGVLPSTGSAGD